MSHNDFGKFEEMMNKMFEETWGIFTKRRPLMSISVERAIEKYRGYRTLSLYETDKEIYAKVELPGLNKEDIEINLTEDRLEISVNIHKEERKEKEKEYIYKEIFSENYHQSVSLPGQIEPNNAKASYNNGILEIKMPRKVLIKRSKLKIE